MTRAAEIHDWVLRRAAWLVLIVSCAFFGLLGLAGDLTTFQVGSSLNAPAGPIRLDGFVNVVLGTCCIACSVWAARRAVRLS